jgi:hypothetical protein
MNENMVAKAVVDAAFKLQISEWIERLSWRLCAFA